MGFSVNEDGSITRTNRSLNNSQTPDFIPVSLSKFKGRFWKKLPFFICYISIFAVHCAIIGFAISTIIYNDSSNYHYTQYQKRQQAFQNKDINNYDYQRYCETGDSYYKPEESYHDYERDKRSRTRCLILSIITLCIGISLDWIVLPKVIRNHPNKKHILRCADYIQANLSFNYGFPYIMTNNHIGVLDSNKKKVIIPPNYDVIYWVVPQSVLCAVLDDKQTFYDINGKILKNVPPSYYTKRSTV